MSGLARPCQDLSTLSLDAAFQLDRLEKHKAADLSVVRQFAEFLGSSRESADCADALNLHENPLNVDIFNSAIHRIETAPVVNVSDLEAKLANLIAKMRDVADGRDTEAAGLLKKFCLSLHQALLSVASPFHYQNRR